MTTAKWRGNPCGNGCCDCDCCRDTVVPIFVANIQHNVQCGEPPNGLLCTALNRLYIFNMALAEVIAPPNPNSCFLHLELPTIAVCDLGVTQCIWTPEFNILRYCASGTGWRRKLIFSLLSSAAGCGSFTWEYSDTELTPLECANLSQHALTLIEHVDGSCKGTPTATIQ